MAFSFKSFFDRFLGTEEKPSPNTVVEMVVNPVVLNPQLTLSDAERTHQLKSRLRQIVSFLTEAGNLTPEKVNEFRPEVVGAVTELIKMGQATWDDLDELTAFLKSKGA